MRSSQPLVLIVEDEPAQREVLSYNLTAEGYRIALAENADYHHIRRAVLEFLHARHARQAA